MNPSTTALACLTLVAIGMGGCGERRAGVAEEAALLRSVLLRRSAGEARPADAAAPGSLLAAREMLASLRSGEDGLAAAGESAAVSGGALLGARILSAPAADGADAPKTGGAAEETPAPAERWWQRPLAGRSFGEVVKDDIGQVHREFWKSTKDSANVPGLLILAGAGGLSAVSRGSWDHRVDRSFERRRNGIFDKEGDFGSIAGNPVLHFGLAMAAYGAGVQAQNDELYGFSKTMMQALMLNAVVTTSLKLAANDHGPNREHLAWPSGHTSSTATMAGVAWEYYGWPVGVPLYLLTGWVATSRLDDREHWLSDVIFGAALGAVIGHSTARGRTIEVGGFAVVPYASPDGGGVMLIREF